MQRIVTSLALCGLLLPVACAPDCAGPGAADPDGGTASSSSSSSSTGGASSTSTSSSTSSSSSSSGTPGDGGTDVDGGDGGGPPTLQLIEVVPNNGVVTGGFRVRVNGAGFRWDSRDGGAASYSTEIWFGDNRATRPLFINSRTMTVEVPPAAGPGAVDVRVANPGGDGGLLEEAVLEDGFTYFDAVTVLSVEPGVIQSTGGTSVTIRGSGFKPAGDGGPTQLVVLGGRMATDVVVASDGNSLTAIAPPHEAGRVDVEVVSEFGTGRLPLGVRYVAPLRVDYVAPAVGPLAGGNIVSIHGAGLTDTTRAFFGSSSARVVDFVGEDELRVAVPATSTAGAVDVRVEDDPLAQTFTSEDAYAYLQDSGTGAALLGVSPTSGPRSGGTTVHLFGRELDGENLSVKFGAAAATGVQVVDATHLTAVTPLAAATGPVSVTVSRGGTDLVLANAFTYADRVDLISLSPVSGPMEGGTELNLTGAGFSSDCEFTLGGRPLAATITDENTATAASPIGSPGPVDLVVSCLSGSDTLVGAYTYAGTLQVIGVEPIRGSIAGGTFVRIRGAGFGTRTSLNVLFGDLPVVDMNIESDNLITARTPPHGPGGVSVEINVGTESAERPRGFTYYDPSSIVGGARGGTILGSVNITAYDPYFGVTVPGALAVLGTETGAQYSGFTDVNGRVTLSGPDVFGHQTVTVAHCNYYYTTMAGINAADITVWLTPMFFPRCGTPSPPQQPPPPPPLPPPPRISGIVTGFAKELFDPANLGLNEVAAAFVLHTWGDLGGPPNNWQMAPSQIVFVEGGRYEIPIAWRTGPMAVVAIAGIYNVETFDFRATQLGFHRGLIADLGGVYEDRDIVLTLPLTKRLVVQFPDAPYVSPDVTSSFMVPFLNLGGEGYHNIFGWEREGFGSPSQFVIENFADAPGDLFTFYGSFYGASAGQPPVSFVLQDGEGVLGPAAALGPLMNFPELVSPTANGAMEARAIRIKPPTGQVPSIYEFTLQTQDGTVWYAYLEGNRTKLILPRFDEYPSYEYAPPNLPPGGIFGRLESVFIPGFDYNNWSYYELWGYSRRSWSDIDFRFVNAGN